MNTNFGKILATTTALLITGRTTCQMSSAPIGALYIWPDNQLAYPVRLAAHIGRHDLKIRSAFPTLSNPKMLSCIRPSAMVIDHAVAPTQSITEAIAYARKRHIPVSLGGTL